MKRTSVVLLVMALLIGYGALAWLGITIIQQGSELRSIEAKLPSPVAVSSPVPTASPSTSPVPILSPGTNPGYAGLAWVTDNLGHTWVRGDWSLPDTAYPPVPVPAKSNVTFKAVGYGGNYNLPVEFAYTVITPNPLPSEAVLCGWGGQSCSWTVPATAQSIGIRVYVRLIGAPHRLSSSGAFDASDGWTELPFQIASS